MKPRPAGRTDLRRQNTHLLLYLIQTQGPISQADLARRSGLSTATVSGILQPLITKGLIVATGKNTEQSMGRRASLLTFNRELLMTLGVVIETEECKVALVDFTGNVVGSEDMPYCPPYEPENIAEHIVEPLERLLQNHGISREALVGVGVAVPGLVDADTGIVKVAVNLGWEDIQLKTILEDHLHLPVSIEHLGKAKIVAETIWGTGVGWDHIVLLEIGSGIGAGCISGSHLLRGATHSAVEVGHITLDIHGPLCTCGLRGCWEVFCSGPAIRKRIADWVENHPEVSTKLDAESSLQDLHQAAEAGDELAVQIVQETAQYMARGLMNVIWNFDPELIILTGCVVEDCPIVIEAAREELQTLEVVRDIDVQFKGATQGKDAGIIAASALVSRQHLEKLAHQAERLQV